MTKENKLALVVGFGLVLLVGILISDHFSTARKQAAAELVQVSNPLVLRDRQNEPQLLDFQPPAPPPQQQQQPQDDPANVIQMGGTNPYDERVSIDPHTLDLPPQNDFRASREQQVVNVLDQPRYDTEVQWVDIGVDANGNRVLRPVQPPTHAPQQQPTRNTAAGTVLAPGEKSHTIAAGESLSSICAKYYGDRSLVKDLAKYNNLSNPDIVRSGDALRIPTIQTLAGPSAIAKAQATNTEKPAKTAAPKSYTIQGGDTLSTIAAKLMGSAGQWEALYEFNKDVLEDPETIIAGTVIKIPN